MRRILVPTDFSENANHAMQIAARLARQTGAVLELLHVNTALSYAIPFPEYYGGGLYDMDQYYETAVRELYELKTKLAKQPEFAQLHIETRLEEGLLFAALRRLVEEDKIDLVVMGTKGATGLNEFFLGSNTEKVIRTAPCDVLAVPNHSGDFDPQTVVVPTTLLPGQAAIFVKLAAWQQFFPLKIKILYLNNPAELEDDDAIEEAARTLAADAGVKDVESVSSFGTFEEEGSILQFAREEKADMIAMATNQRRGVSHLLFGSLTEDTINHSGIPVLSVPAST